MEKFEKLENKQFVINRILSPYHDLIANGVNCELLRVSDVSLSACNHLSSVFCD